MSPVTILVVEKNGTLKEVEMKVFDEEELFKRAGYKTKDGFVCHTQWAIPELQGKTYTISVYGKTTGRANQENKYEFPPPIDTVLFFGNCVLVNRVNEVATSLTAKEWDLIYQFLYGGFEDIEDEEEEDDEDEEEEEEENVLPRTKTGYVKDNFVVDDDDEEEDEEEEEEEDEESEEEVVKKLPKKSVVKGGRTKKTAAILSVFDVVEEEAVYLNCESELTEEEYV